MRIAIIQTNYDGRVIGWILDRTTKGAARRAWRGGADSLAMQLEGMRGRQSRGITPLGAGWTMITGEAGR